MGINHPRQKSVLKKRFHGLRNSRGQIAIFVALVFQILFLFFAMVINVGLLVHHKINLQNSVDLAAYYGAMKQAESLNAIAHVNYQIRQAYKLMVYRYWSLGTGGDVNFQNSLNGSNPGESLTDMAGTFCLGYTPWNFVASNETYCKTQSSRLSIRLPQTSTLAFANGLVNPFFQFQNSVNDAITKTRTQIQTNCRDTVAINYYALARFVFGWKYDVQNRRKLLMQLARELSDRSGGKDLDGESIATGIENTLKNNLTSPNKEGVQFNVFNSLGAGGCGPTGNENEAPRWLKEIYILPYMMYMNAICDDPQKITGKRSYVVSTIPQDELPSGMPQAKATIQAVNDANSALAPYLEEPPGNDPQANLYKSMVGYEKNPWCMAYIGVSATAKPKIPFSPFGAVTLTARAFAKPFGGSVGPWYKNAWSPAADHSDGPDMVDKMLPPRSLPGQPVDAPTSAGALGNYSRYVGDQVGFISKMGLWDFARAFLSRNRPLASNNAFNLSTWNHLFHSSYDWNQIGSEGDSLAWSYPSPGPGPGFPATGNWRDVEIAAVAPNQFDVTYYSIEPDFYKNYLARLINREQRGQFNFSVRGDYGSKRNNADKVFTEFSVKDQVKAVAGANNVAPPIDVTVQSYFVRKFEELLTWYQSESTEAHILDQKRFGKCPFPVPDTATVKDTVPGNCIAGGRTGYSVKLVDGHFLQRGDLKMGGEFAPSGPLRNQWADSDLPLAQ